MFDGWLPDDPGDDLSAAAVEALRSSSAVRACADAVELQAIATLVQVRRGQARTEARRLTAVRRREAPGATVRPVRVDLEAVDRCTAQEVSLALWLSPVVARARIQLALELVEERPATFDALRCGAIDLARARRIVEAVRALGSESLGSESLGSDALDVDAVGSDAARSDAARSDAARSDAARSDAAAAVEAEALYPGSVPLLAEIRPGRPASELTPAQLTARLARLVLRAAPTSAARRTEVADERRACTLRVLPDGMALLSVTGRMELLGAVFTRIDATARALVSQRAESTAASTGALARVGAPGVGGVPGVGGAPVPVSALDVHGLHDVRDVPDVRDAEVPHDPTRTLDRTRVDVLLATLLGHSDDLGQAHGVQVTLALVAPAATVLAGGDGPGELAGLGAVPAPLVRELAADAAWVRWLSDPVAGQVVDVGRRRYRPSAAVADLVRARGGRCRFSSCRRRARACDLDHVLRFPHGPTDACNLCALCRTHHLAKHRGGFRLRLDPDGTAVWTTPTGRVVVDPPQTWGACSPATASSDPPDRVTGVGSTLLPF